MARLSSPPFSPPSSPPLTFLFIFARNSTPTRSHIPLESLSRSWLCGRNQQNYPPQFSHTVAGARNCCPGSRRRKTLPGLARNPGTPRPGLASPSLLCSASYLLSLFCKSPLDNGWRRLDVCTHGARLEATIHGFS